MPNQPKTPNRVVRVPDDEWTPALAKARAEGTTLTAVIRDAIRAYLRTLSAALCALVALVLLSGCGGSADEPTEPQASAVAVRTTAPVVVEPSESPSATPSCWSLTTSTWMDDYNKVITDQPAALAVLDALPDPHYGCTAADVADLVRAHDIAARTRAGS